MLSIPYSLLAPSLATKSSSNSYKISPRTLLESTLFFIHFIISSEVFTSQIPSHPIITNYIFSFFIFDMSGFAVIICYSGVNLVFCLYYKSPNALDKFKFPFTLPKETSPPAFLILSSSILSSGLWSFDISLVVPLIQATPLESPALAT